MTRRIRKFDVANSRQTDTVNALMGVLAAGPQDLGRPRSPRDRLIEQHMQLVTSIARRYANRGERLEDLVQVGAIGLIKAADRFDARRGVEFRAYAIPTIVGEIKRHLRDRSSTIRVPRREQEARRSLRRARNQLGTHLARTPTWSELVTSAALREDELARALDAERATTPLSLSTSSDSEPAVDETGFAAGEDRALVWAGLRTLDGPERRAVSLCYFAGLSQREIAASLGISQSAASRTIARALQKMRSALADDRKTFVRQPSSA
jgi:RNA polymerase sigma-B factor